MVLLIAIDGNYLNRALRKKAHVLHKAGDDLPETRGKPRLRIDFGKLGDLLALPHDRHHEDVVLNYYTDASNATNSEKIMGRITKYWPDRRYGFIQGVDGNSYFFHNKDLFNKGFLKKKGEKRYPRPTSREFASRVKNKIVSFKVIENDDLQKLKAAPVYLERGGAIDRFYRLRREPFLAMLEDTGYNIIRSKNQNIDCRICLDAMRELSDYDDRLVLVSDDEAYIDLIKTLQEDGIETTTATFEAKNGNPLCEPANDLIVLDDHIEDIQYEYEEEPSIS